MAKATWKGTLLAESEETQRVDGALYFPVRSANQEYFEESGADSVCSWKGFATYFNIRVDKDVLRNAAWIYREPLSVARHIKGYVAFWDELVADD